MKSKWLLTFVGFSGASAVALGAFAAHGLKSQLSPYLLGVFETGVMYQFWHTLAIACALFCCLCRLERKRKNIFSARQFVLSSASFALAAAYTPSH